MAVQPSFLSHLVEKPEERFYSDAAHLGLVVRKSVFVFQYKSDTDRSVQQKKQLELCHIEKSIDAMPSRWKTEKVMVRLRKFAGLTFERHFCLQFAHVSVFKIYRPYTKFCNSKF